MDAITFRILIGLSTVLENLDMHLMDVVTIYLYKFLNNDIYMKVSKEFKISETYKSSFWEPYSIKLQRSSYGLKQLGQM